MNDKKNNGEVKNNVVTGASTVAGAAAGVGLGAVITPGQAEAAEVINPQPEPKPIEPKPAEPKAAESKTIEPKLEPKIEQEPEADSEVEVLGYDRFTNQDGSQSDMAVLDVNGTQVVLIDTDLDGEADWQFTDYNHNGEIDPNERMDIHGQGLAMQPLADMAGFKPEFAENTIPDYINDADVDTFMA